MMWVYSSSNCSESCVVCPGFTPLDCTISPRKMKAPLSTGSPSACSRRSHKTLLCPSGQGRPRLWQCLGVASFRESKFWIFCRLSSSVILEVTPCLFRIFAGGYHLNFLQVSSGWLFFEFSSGSFIVSSFGLSLAVNLLQVITRAIWNAHISSLWTPSTSCNSTNII